MDQELKALLESKEGLCKCGYLIDHKQVQSEMHPNMHDGFEKTELSYQCFNCRREFSTEVRGHFDLVEAIKHVHRILNKD